MIYLQNLHWTFSCDFHVIDSCHHIHDVTVGDGRLSNMDKSVTWQLLLIDIC